MGKSSLLEALSLVTANQSFRTKWLADAVQTGQKGFLAKAKILFGDLLFDIEISYLNNKKSILINGRPFDEESSFFGRLAAVIIPPNVHELIQGAPPWRRHFLDSLLSQIDPLYCHHLSRYFKGLRQRNWLLKKKDFKLCPCFERELSKAGAYIIERRRHTVKRLKVFVLDAFQSLYDPSSERDIDVEYQTEAPKTDSIEELADYLATELGRRRAQEATLGATLVGPHRDDLEMMIGGQAARRTSSQGEARLGSIALKLAQGRLIAEETGELPALLVDDFCAFLDDTKAYRLFQQLKGFGQLFLTKQSPFGYDGGESYTFEMVNGKIQSPKAMEPNAVTQKQLLPA